MSTHRQVFIVPHDTRFPLQIIYHHHDHVHLVLFKMDALPQPVVQQHSEVIKYVDPVDSSIITTPSSLINSEPLDGTTCGV